MSALFGTGELLFTDDAFTDRDGGVLARVERPRRSWRSIFTSAGDLRIVRADGSLLFEMPDLAGEDLTELRVAAADGLPAALVKKKRRLAPFKLEFTVQDDAGAPMGTVKTNPAWDSLTAEDPSGSPIADAETSGRSWTVDLRPDGSAGWNAVVLAMVVAADEMQNKLFGMG